MPSHTQCHRIHNAIAYTMPSHKRIHLNRQGAEPMPKSPRTFAVIAFSVLAAVLIAAGAVISIERINNSRRSHALACARLLGLAAIQYAQDNNEHYPDAGRWEQEIRPYLALSSMSGYRDIIHPPAPIGGVPRQFSLNPALSGKALAQVKDPTDTWLFYESLSPNTSASDNLAFFPNAAENSGANSAVVFGDGHSYTQGRRWLSLCQSQSTGVCGGGMPD